jgi:uncharacterized protein YndB with AHSA1/START domain
MAKTMTVTRSTVIDAPAERIYAELDDFRRWPQWSPWEELDPNMTHTYSGAESGIGAIQEWKGNKKAGEGRMEITGSDAPNQLDMALTFIKPFKSQNTTTFALVPGEGGTTVTWSMLSPLNLPMKIYGIFKNLDTMIGADFEKGLARLNSVVTS